MINFNVELIGDAKLPQKAHDSDVGYDLVAAGEPEIVGVYDESGNEYGWERIDYIQYKTGVKVSGKLILKRRLGEEIVFDNLHSLIYPRSSISKYNLVLANSVGVIDPEYTGEILVRFKYVAQPEDLILNKNTGRIFVDVKTNRIYKKGDKIAQLVPMKQLDDVKFTVVDKIGETKRGAGGFGSTGV